MCKQWVDFCNRPELWKKYEENGPDYLYKSSRICSDHFQPADFNNPNLFSQGLKKGSVPTLYPASKEPKSRYGIAGAGISAISGIGFAALGGGGISNGHNSPPNTNNDNDSSSLIIPMTTKRPMLSQPSAQQPVAKRRSLPPALSSTLAAATNSHAAAVSGVLAGLIQRQQQKEQQRKVFAAALQLQQRHQQQQQQQVQPNPQRSLLASLKQKPNSNNNNNNHISTNNNNNTISAATNNIAKLAAAALQERLEDERGYGINYVDMDGGDSSEFDASYQNAIEEELAAYKQLQQMKAIKAAAAVIPASLKSELTVTPAVNHNNNKTSSFNRASTGSTSRNSASPPSSSTGAAASDGTINYKEKYEQSLKELFACRKIVKNQNNAIKQLQGEIDFLNQLLKEK